MYSMRIQRVQDNTKFQSKNNPIKPFVMNTKYGRLYVAEISQKELKDEKFLRNLVRFFIKNFASSTKDPYWLEYNKNPQNRGKMIDGYIDYLCPQLYWTNSHSVFPFNETLLRFIEARTNPDVKLYVGIASYKAGLKSEEPEWYTNKNVLKNMISFSRKTNEVDGFMFFRYDYFISKKNNAALKNMLTELKKSN